MSGRICLALERAVRAGGRAAREPPTRSGRFVAAAANPFATAPAPSQSGSGSGGGGGRGVGFRASLRSRAAEVAARFCAKAAIGRGGGAASRFAAELRHKVQLAGDPIGSGAQVQQVCSLTCWPAARQLNRRPFEGRERTSAAGGGGCGRGQPPLGQFVRKRPTCRAAAAAAAAARPLVRPQWSRCEPAASSDAPSGSDEKV